MSKINTYKKIIKYLNRNNLTYREVIGTYSNSLIIDCTDVSNHYFMINLSHKLNSKCVILDISFDLEDSNGKLYRQEQRISYNQLIRLIGEQ